MRTGVKSIETHSAQLPLFILSDPSRLSWCRLDEERLLRVKVDVIGFLDLDKARGDGRDASG